MNIPRIKRILYATDLSKNAKFAFGYAASLANCYDAKISILHVLEQLSHSSNVRLSTILGEDRLTELSKRSIQEVLDTVAERLDRFCQEMGSEMTECPFIVGQVLVKEGEPVEEILHQAELLDSDIIVMGTHGHGMLTDAMMGSTARRIVRRSSTPVFVIRLPEDD